MPDQKIAEKLSESLHLGQTIQTTNFNEHKAVDLPPNIRTHNQRYDTAIDLKDNIFPELIPKMLASEPHRLSFDGQEKLFPAPMTTLHFKAGKILEKYSEDGNRGYQTRLNIINHMNENKGILREGRFINEYLEDNPNAIEPDAQQELTKQQNALIVKIHESRPSQEIVKTMRLAELGNNTQITPDITPSALVELYNTTKSLRKEYTTFMQTDPAKFERSADGRYINKDSLVQYELKRNQTRPSSPDGIEPAQERPSKIQRLTPQEVGSDTETVAPNSPRPELDERSRDPREQTGL